MIGDVSPPSVALFGHVYIVGTGRFLPGAPVDNDSIDRFIAPLDRKSERIKRRVLRDNGIQTRHYAIDESGQTQFSSWQLAEHAINDAIAASPLTIDNISLLCSGSSGGDTGMPGFANMVQGALGLGPMEASSHQGICAAGLQALKYAASSVELGAHDNAIVVSAELPSRLFKRSRFEPQGYRTDFDAQFLRWMLSDGAGACTVSRTVPPGFKALKVDWIHSRAFSGDYPVCMQIGYASPSAGDNAPRSYLDYPSLADAERDGAFLLRQDIRLLPNLFEVGIHEYAALAAQGLFDPCEIDHFLCHYSSEKFSGMVDRLMHDSGLAIPRERWYSNLKWRGNTGAASIFIMLADFMREKQPRTGERILCFVPESGRFTVSCMLLTVTEGETEPSLKTKSRLETAEEIIAPPHPPSPHSGDIATRSSITQSGTRKQTLLRDLAEVWHRYRSRAWRTGLVRRILSGELTREDYLQWMSCWIPQVREGSLWMSEAAGNITEPFLALAPLVEAAANDEQLDYTILFDDYRNAGGTVECIEDLKRNPGGDALNAYMHGAAARPNPVGLLGGTYIIEGTGQRIIPHLLPRLRRCPEIPSNSLRFLHYHGENDIAHLERWLDAVNLALDAEPANWVRDAIVQTASDTAELYLMQMRTSIHE